LSDHDAVVVGSGPNGLAAAITLARAGRDVLVLEAADRYGGAVVTEELTLPGFHHDTMSAVYPAAAASPVFEAFELDRHGLEWVHPRWCMAHPVGDGRAAALGRDVDATTETLERLHPGDGRSWSAWVRPYLNAFEGLRRTVLGGFPPLRGVAWLAAGLGPKGMLEFARVALAPAEAVAHELFRAPGSRAWLYGTAMHSDVPATAPGSAIPAVYLDVLGHAVGWPSPRGGAGALSDALVRCLQAHGGRVRTRARVTRVTVAHGRVSGIELAGERISAGLVIADVSPHGLLALAGDAVGERYAAALRRYRYGPSTLKVDWALDGPIPWEAEEPRGAGTVHVGGPPDDVLGAAVDGTPFMLLGQQSLADPTRAPAGRHTAWAYTHGPHTADWEGRRDEFVERMEARVETFAPGFRDRILARHVQAPADLQRRNANLIRGDVGNGSNALDQLVFRPVPTLAPYRTPVRGLYLGSAAAFPGGGVHGGPGHAAARLALTEQRIRPRGRSRGRRTA
jgi:phytoene dehydrogenase-like protein